MLYRLPTRAARDYRGAYPDRIHSISLSGMDCTQTRSIQFETNAGERFTCTYDLLDMDRINGERSLTKRSYTWLLKGRVEITEMSQDTYDHWLATIRRQRQAADAMRRNRALQSTNWIK